jgi:hypothetical protein
MTQQDLVHSEDLASGLLSRYRGRDPKTKLKRADASNKEIASRLSISPRTAKQHLRALTCALVSKDGRKRVKLATAHVYQGAGATNATPVIG